MRLFPLLLDYNVNMNLEIMFSIICIGWFIYYYLEYVVGSKIIEIKYGIRYIFFILIGIMFQMLEG